MAPKTSTSLPRLVIVKMGRWTGGRRFSGEYIEPTFLSVAANGELIEFADPNDAWSTDDYSTAKTALRRVRNRVDARGTFGIYDASNR